MKWRLIPMFRDGKGRARIYSYVLAMKVEDEEMPSYEVFTAAQKWCYEQMGHQNWRNTGWDFEFVNHADAVAFKMRWG